MLELIVSKSNPACDVELQTVKLTAIPRMLYIYNLMTCFLYKVALSFTSISSAGEWGGARPVLPRGSSPGSTTTLQQHCCSKRRSEEPSDLFKILMICHYVPTLLIVKVLYPSSMLDAYIKMHSRNQRKTFHCVMCAKRYTVIIVHIEESHSELWCQVYLNVEAASPTVFSADGWCF